MTSLEAKKHHSDMEFDLLVKNAISGAEQRFINIPEGFKDLLGEISETESANKKIGVVHPEHAFRSRWDVMMLLLVLYYAVMTPVSMGFDGVGEALWVEMLFNALFITGENLLTKLLGSGCVEN